MKLLDLDGMDKQWGFIEAHELAVGAAHELGFISHLAMSRNRPVVVGVGTCALATGVTFLFLKDRQGSPSHTLIRVDCLPRGLQW